MDNDNASAPTIVMAGGIQAVVDAYAIRPSEDSDHSGTVALLSMIASSTATQAVWATLIKGDHIRLGDEKKEKPPQYAMRKEDGSIERYRQFRKVLPKFGKAHLLLMAEPALTDSVRAGQDFIVVRLAGESEETFLSRFKTAWDRALPHPALDEWTRALIRHGRNSMLVSNLESHGCSAVHVVTDVDCWGEIVSRIALAVAAGEEKAV